MSETNKYTIAYQGATGAFSHLAAQKFTDSILKGKQVSFVPSTTFDDVFDHACHQENGLACVPFENSTIGSIIQNYQLLWKSELKIFGELSLPIHHQLMALPGTKMEDVIDVYSHPVALDQCKRLFKEHAWIQPQIYFDTGASARFIKEEKKRNAAAIAAKQAAEEYGLEIIAPDIEDYPQNQTRFLLMGMESTKLGRDLKAPYKITAALEPGADLNVLKMVTAELSDQFKLLKIEALPVPEKPFQFRLFIDFHVLADSAKSSGEKALKGLRNYGAYKGLEQN